MSDFILQNRDRDLSTIGLLITMASIIMLFSTLISSFFVLKIRLMKPIIFPGNVTLMGYVNTAILIGSSITFFITEKKYQINKPNGFDLWLLFTIMGGMVFLLGQLLLWSELTTMGIPFTFGQLSDMFYVISGAHGLHILVGLGLLIWIQLSKHNHYSRIHHVGIFWHFLGIIWTLLFASFILL